MSRRLLGVVSGAGVMFLAGGAVYGYEAIRPVMVQEGAFGSGCTPHGGGGCDSQRRRLGLVFTFAMASLFTFVLGFGFVMDRFGARFTMALAVFLNVVGTGLVLAAPLVAHGNSGASGEISDALWGIGFVLWGVNSPGVFSSVLSLSSVIPEYSGWIISFMIAVFDTASAVFLAFKLLYEHAGVSWSWLCGGYMVCVLVCGVCCAAVLPNTADRARTDELHGVADVTPLLSPDGLPRSTSSGSAMGKGATDRNVSVNSVQSLELKETAKDYDTEPTVAHSQSWREHAVSLKFVLVTAFMMVFSLRNTFYIGSFGDQMNAVSSKDASQASLVFSIMFPAGAVVAFPVSGFILKACKGRDDWLFGCVWAMGVAHGVLNTIPNMTAQYLAMAIFPIVRTLKWSAVSHYVITRFPMAHFGRLFGVINFSIGLFNLLVYPLYDVSLDGRGVGNFTPVNVGLTIAQCVCIALPLAIRFKLRADVG